MRRFLLPIVATSTWVALLQGPAWAPQMVTKELAAQRALGYQPCEPKLSQVPADRAEQGVLADAAPDIMFQECEIRFTSNIPAKDLDWIAWHEVCHLSTMNQIYADPHRDILDPAHRHPLFLACISQGPVETGGYLK